MSTMTVTFPGGKRVDAEYGGYTIRTDQPPQGGGEGTAPPPFDLFLASIATCAGIYVKGYCDARGLATEGLGLSMQIEREPEKHRVVRLVLEIKLPEGFPEKHREGVIRAADLCAVKKHILQPPAFEVRTVQAGTTTVALAIPGVSLRRGTNYTVSAGGLLSNKSPAALPAVDAP